MSAQASSNSAAATASNKALNENLILKSYEKKVKEDIRLISDNLLEMIKLLKIETDSTLKNYDDFNISKVAQADIDSFEIQIRTCNVVTATESLSKIVSDLKDLTILNDFKSINNQINNQCNFLKQKEFDIDRQLTSIKDMLAKLLSDLQHEYYTSNYK